MFKGRQFSGSFDLKTTFNNPDIVRAGNNFDEILAGLTMQPSQTFDTNFVEDVSFYTIRLNKKFNLMVRKSHLSKLFKCQVYPQKWATNNKLKKFIHSFTSYKSITKISKSLIKNYVLMVPVFICSIDTSKV